MFDWITIGAQALNFLILVWLMKRFLYQPILRAIDEREKGIAKELAEADAIKGEAQKEREVYRLMNEDFDRQKATLVSQATEEANAQRLRLFEEARQSADDWSLKVHEASLLEQQNLHAEFTRRIHEEIFAMVRKALIDLAGTDLEQRMSEIFSQRLRDLSGVSKAHLAEALKSASAPAIVRSAFDLQSAERATLQKSINEAFSMEVQLQFETSPNALCGIELSVQGQRVAWSMGDYLDQHEKRVLELFKTKAKAESKVEPDTKPEPDLSPGSEIS